ncbi:MAG: hypothetical protein RIR79_1691 [Pseudomonadota bacterium]
MMKGKCRIYDGRRAEETRQVKKEHNNPQHHEAVFKEALAQC